MRRRHKFVIAAIAVAMIALLAVPIDSDAGRPTAQRHFRRPSVKGSGPEGLGGHWKLILNENFSKGFDTRYWSDSRYGNGLPASGFTRHDLECFVPSATTFTGGVADLRLARVSERCNGHPYRYSSGILTTYGKWSYRYGFAEARVWVPGSGKIADWPAVWATGNSWPRHGEIDILEGTSAGKECVFFHSALPRQGNCFQNHLTGGWHTVAANWEPGRITWYYDGAAIYRVTSGVTRSPMILNIDLALTTKFRSPVLVPATMKVAFIRVWKKQAVG